MNEHPFGNAPAGAEGIQWGIDRMQEQGKHIDVPSLHAFLRAHDLHYGIEYIELMIEMGRVLLHE